MIMTIAIRGRAVFHGPNGQGRIWGDWQTFDNLASPEAIHFVFGITKGGVYRAESHSDNRMWRTHGYQRITYVSNVPDGVNRLTVHVLRIDVHGPVPCPKACICVDCLTALLEPVGQW